MRKTILSAIVVYSLFAPPTSAGVILSRIHPDNGHTYHLLEPTTWAAAEAEANSLGGHLVTINDAAEDEWLGQAFGRQDILTGLNDLAEEGTFIWSSGEPVEYTNWQPGEPNNARDDESFASKEFCCGHTGDWNDVRDSDFGRFSVAEIPTNASPPAPDIRRWAFEATVVELDDPLGVFAAYRLGDPVRGLFSYDLSTPADAIDPTFASYYHTDDFPIAEVVIENPRGGREFEFTPQGGGRVDVLNDEFDSLLATQYLAPIPGVSDGQSELGIAFDTVELPINVLDDTSLPEAINLADWPVAALFGLVGEPFGPNSSLIVAEIFSLTRVETPTLPGDVDSSGRVDGRDLLAIQRSEPEMIATWQANFGADQTVVARNVPEPTAAALLIGVCLLASIRRRTLFTPPRPSRS